MSFDDAIPDIWCLMSVETCFLTICNDLGWGFWPKKSHFLSFWRWRERIWCLEYGLMGFVRK